MADAIDILRWGLASADHAMRTALAGISSEEMARDPGDGLRSIESLLGEAILGLRDALAVIGHDDLPAVPEGFEVRYARWGTGAELDEARHDLAPIFAEHMKTLDGVVRGLGPDDLDESVDASGSFDGDGLFSFETIGGAIAAIAGFLHILAGELSVIRLALGKAAVPDLLDGVCGGSADLPSDPAGTPR